MDRFVEKLNLPRLNQEEAEIMKNPITSTEIEAVIKTLPQNKSPGLTAFHSLFIHSFIISALHDRYFLFSQSIQGDRQ